MRPSFFVLIACVLLLVFLLGLRAGRQGSSSLPGGTEPLPTARLRELPNQPPPAGGLAPRSKTSGCQVRDALPDPACTPGATDPRVSQANVASTICQPGYTKTVRPPVEYTDRLKGELMQAYGLSGERREYELDHLVPLELGGNPTDPANLWPEAAEPSPGYHEKDKVENYLHDQVCQGSLSLEAAQRQIASDWLQVYRQLPAGAY